MQAGLHPAPHASRYNPREKTSVPPSQNFSKFGQCKAILNNHEVPHPALGTIVEDLPELTKTPRSTIIAEIPLAEQVNYTDQQKKIINRLDTSGRSPPNPRILRSSSRRYQLSTSLDMSKNSRQAIQAKEADRRDVLVSTGKTDLEPVQLQKTVHLDPAKEIINATDLAHAAGLNANVLDQPRGVIKHAMDQKQEVVKIGLAEPSPTSVVTAHNLERPLKTAQYFDDKVLLEEAYNDELVSISKASKYGNDA